MKHFDFPVDATDFIFVEHWDSDDRLHAAKIFNYCFKKYLKSRYRQDILNDVVLFILDDFVRRKKPIIRRKTKPRDLINFLNKDIPNKYFGFRPLSIDAFFLDKKDKDKSVQFASRDYEDKESEIELWDAIDSKLTSCERDILIMHYVEGKTCIEIANEQDIKSYRIVYRKEQALKKLKKALE